MNGLTSVDTKSNLPISTTLWEIIKRKYQVHKVQGKQFHMFIFFSRIVSSTNFKLNSVIESKQHKGFLDLDL